MHHFIHKIIVVGFILATSFVLGSQKANAGSCATNCTGVPGSGMTCTVSAMLACPAGYPIVFNRITQVAVSSYGANCAAGGLMATATHMVGAGTNSGTYAKCVFFFAQSCNNSASTMAVNDNANCTVNAAGDGLPVELLEFSVDVSD